MKWPQPDADNDITWGECAAMWLGCGLASIFAVFLGNWILDWAPVGLFTKSLRESLAPTAFVFMFFMTMLCVLMRFAPGPARLKEDRRQRWLDLKDEFEDEE